MSDSKNKGAFRQVLERELNRMVSRRLYFGVCIVLPLFCIFFMSTIFGTGEIEKVPIGIVDMDQTATSRTIVRTMSTVPTSEIVAYYADPLQARDAVLRKEIYGYLVIPNNFEADLYGGRSASLPYYYHYALLSVGVELFSAFESTLSSLSISPLIKAAEFTGVSSQRAQSAVIPINVESHPLFNPSLDYSIYLSIPFFFILLQVLVLLTTSYVLGSEIKFKTADSWMKAAKGNIFVAVVAKLLPYSFIFIFMGLLANFVMFGIKDIPLDSGFLPINLATILFILSTQAFGLLIFSFFPALSLIISVISMTGSLGATLSGVTFPVAYMHPVIYYLSYLFPVRHFIEVIQSYLYGGYGFAYVWQNVAYLFVFILLSLLMLPRLKKAILSRKYEDIE